MQKNEKNSGTLNTATKTDAVHNEPNETRLFSGVMSQKFIVDKYSKDVTEFLTFKDDRFTQADWFPKKTFLSMLNEQKDKSSISYKLKNSSVAEGMKKAQDGKAVQINLNVNDVTVLIYVQSALDKLGEWRYSHGYKIDRRIYDAYALVITNDADTSMLEQKAKVKTNASLSLG